MEKSRAILLISDHPDDTTFLAQAAQSAEAKIHVEPDPEKAVEFLSKHACTAVFIDVSKIETLTKFEHAAQKRFGLFSDRIQAPMFHFISDKPLFESRDVIKSPFFSSYFQRPEEENEASAKLYGRFVLASEKKATHDLKHFLSAKARVQGVTLTQTDQKQEAVEAVRQYLIQAKIPARISNIVANAVDELLMNALFDAPCDEFGKGLYTATDRAQSRDLQGKELVQMRIGFDGFYVGVSVTDFFGAIDRSRLLNHVSLDYSNRDYTIKHGQAGAGLGLSTIFHSGGSLIFHCENREKTEVTLLYRAFSSFREFKTQFRFVSAKFYV